MPQRAILIGAFIRWLFKGCKTKLKDEIEGNFKGKWCKSYDFENYIIGIVTGIVITVITYVIVFII